ncbi:MAG: 5-(carboxyamino)imidazole ribonucleotide synthase [Chromatiales bacterium 21-64-14]|nr:MAG: 5-(carboxyamino)imidazole ribonucleotide synthase [Chromatiales bacterium 21-64-14]HQU17024.1 5-(carboxyamino)imidazole ribonucleotide synthase [Gammaproteobacteria bacterium]
MIVGVLGGGQLARMLALAGRPLGLDFVFLSPDPESCAAPLGTHLCAGFDDETALARLAEYAGIVTYEFENAPLDSVRYLAERVPVVPSTQALAAAQDRLAEKSLFERLGIGTPAFVRIDDARDLPAACRRTGFPAVLKTRRMGYDGKGQVIVGGEEDLGPAWARLGGKASILEAFVPYDREVSLVAVRARGGRTAFYPLSENTHQDGILRLSVSRPDDPMEDQARARTVRLLDALDYIGVLALEFFQVGDQLLANEFAPRVHNSGHWTIEGAECSQFENHLRAIIGWPLGATTRSGPAAMVNFIGTVPDAAEVLALPGVHLHHYGKSPRRGRKLGHATVRSDSQQQVEETARALMRLAAATTTD